MSEWIFIGLALALMLGVFTVPYALLFKPWRMKSLAYWLMARWPWYESWVPRLILGRMTQHMQQVNEALGQELIPALRKAATAFRDLEASLT